MTRNFSLRLQIDLIAAADMKLTKRGIAARSVNELVRTVLLDFCATESEVDEYAAYQYIKEKFGKKNLTSKLPTVEEFKKLSDEVKGDLK